MFWLTRLRNFNWTFSLYGTGLITKLVIEIHVDIAPRALAGNRC